MGDGIGSRVAGVPTGRVAVGVVMSVADRNGVGRILSLPLGLEAAARSAAAGDTAALAGTRGKSAAS